MTGVIVILALFGPRLPGIDAELEQTILIKTDEGKLLAPPYEPSGDFVIGSDRKGVDLLSRIVIGTRETLLTVLGIVLVRATVSLILGIGSFYTRVGSVLLKVWEAVFSFMPTIIIVILLLAIPPIMFSPNRLLLSALIIALAETGRLAEFIRSKMVELSNETYMEAAIASGGSRLGMFRRYYSPIIGRELGGILAREAGRVMFLLAQLGVIGVFINQMFMSQEIRGTYAAVETSDAWPVLLLDLQKDLRMAQWIPVSALAFITFAIISFQLLADGLEKRRAERLGSRG